LALSSNLLQQSGWSQTPTTLGQAMGGAVNAGRQTQNESLNAALQAQLLKSQITRNERGDQTTAQREYEFAKQQGYKGTFEEWKQITQQESAGPASIQEYNLYSEQTKAAGGTPEPFDTWMQRRARMSVGAPFVQTEQAGGKGAFDRRTGGFAPATTLDQEAGAAERLKNAEAFGTAAGKIAGEIVGGIQKKGSDAQGAQRLLEGADALIDIATGSMVGNVRDKFVGAFGYSTDGATAIAELKLLQANLMMQQPRMEGPQSNLDQQLYREMAGLIGEPNVPADQKKAALRKILELQEKYVDRAASQSPPPRPGAPGAPKSETAAERAKRMGL
jgi:hypothetical protein